MSSKPSRDGRVITSNRIHREREKERIEYVRVCQGSVRFVLDYRGSGMLAAIYEPLLGLRVEAATALTIDSQLYHS